MLKLETKRAHTCIMILILKENINKHCTQQRIGYVLSTAEGEEYISLRSSKGQLGRKLTVV